MRVNEKNRKLMAALGITNIEWIRNRSAESDWRVTVLDGSAIMISTHLFCTESSVIREVARIFAAQDRPVIYATEAKA